MLLVLELRPYETGLRSQKKIAVSSLLESHGCRN